MVRSAGDGRGVNRPGPVKGGDQATSRREAMVLAYSISFSTGLVADRGMDPLGVVPLDPLGGCRLDLGFVLPGCPAPGMLDQFGLVQAYRGLHQRVVQSVADTADGAGDSRFFQGFGDAQREGWQPRTGN